MALTIAKDIYARVRAEPRPLRLALGRFLWRSGLCRMFNIAREGYRLHFFPSAFSAGLWTYPDAYSMDEQFFRRVLRPGDVAVDVGANIGTLALCASSCVGPRGRVYAIEAHPRTFGYLAGNIKLNCVANVRAIHAAAGETSGSTAFTDGMLDDQNRVVVAGPVRVPVRSLDELIPAVRPIRLLKIDVEGYELFVLRGARRLLEITECVYFESWKRHYDEFGYRLADIRSLLVGCGFKLFRAPSLEPLPEEYDSRVCENLVALRNPAVLSRTW